MNIYLKWDFFSTHTNTHTTPHNIHPVVEKWKNGKIHENISYTFSSLVFSPVFLSIFLFITDIKFAPLEAV